MNTATIPIVLALLALISLTAFVAGYQRGRAVGWCDRYFAEVAKDRARRNKLGQFTKRQPTMDEKMGEFRDMRSFLER